MKNLFKQMDLTKGNITKNILLFSIPILLSYLLQQIYTISDAAICGQFLNANEVAGINNTSNLVFMVLQFAIGVTAGFSVITSTYYGNNDETGIKKSFAVQIKLSLYLSIFLTILSIIMINPLLSLIGLSDSDNIVQHEIYSASYTYILVIYLGIITQVFYNLICSFLRSVGDSTTPLIFLFISSILNIILDLLFITVFKFGVFGAALATVIAQGISAIGCFTFTFIKYKDYRLNIKDFNINLKFSIKHLKMGLPLALQFSILAIGLIVVQSVIIKFDSNSLNQVVASDAQNGIGAAVKLNNLLMCPFSALGTAMITYCSQNLGANNFTRIKKGVNSAIIIMLFEYIIFGGIGLLLSINGAYLYIFYSTGKITPLSIKYGNAYMLCDMLLYFILGFLYVFRNSIQGLGKPLFPFLAGIGELIARVAVALLIPPLLNNGPINNSANTLSIYGLCFADPAAWLFACIFLLTAGWLYIYSKNAKKRITKNI